MRRPTSTALVLLLLLAGCQRPGAAELLQTAERNLAARDTKLGAYRLRGTVSENGERASFEFAFKRPNKMRGAISGPKSRTVAFDGQTLYERDDGAKTLTEYKVSLGRERAAEVLTQTFAPFIPEGFRAPLIERSDLRAEEVSNPKASKAVALVTRTMDEERIPIDVRYVFRFPEMDFLGKELRYKGNATLTQVEAERCDAKLGLCVPKALTVVRQGQVSSHTELTEIVLGADQPDADFALSAPEGFATVRHELVDAPAKGR